MRVRQTLDDANGVGASLIDLLENTRIGVIHFDRRGRLHAVNDLARGILRKEDGLRDQGGFLRACLPADDARLNKLLKGALPTLFGQAVSSSLMIERPLGLPPLAVHLSPMGDSQMDFGALQAAALALVVDPLSQPCIAPRLAADNPGSTPTES